MFLKQYKGWRLENSVAQILKCPHCGNTTEHYVNVAPSGPQVGFVFMSRPLLGGKRYFLMCPTCGNATREITKAQAETLVRE